MLQTECHSFSNAYCMLQKRCHAIPNAIPTDKHNRNIAQKHDIASNFFSGELRYSHSNRYNVIS